MAVLWLICGPRAAPTATPLGSHGGRLV
jgi:hypothetical protein